MDALSAAAVLITLAALFSWLNHKFIRQPRGVTVCAYPRRVSQPDESRFIGSGELPAMV
jgi:hypothetical protein